VKLLLTNDDGIDAPGLRALELAAQRFGPVTVLAPDRHLSGCGHQVTTHRELTLGQDSEGRMHLDGTPADCVRIALTQLGSDFDFVVSGINDGGNLGVDIHMSGTVAAAREAALLGKRAIALSHYRRRDWDIDWRRATSWAEMMLSQLLASQAPPGTFWNVNFPALDAGEAHPPVVYCPTDPYPLPVNFRREAGGFYYSGRYQDRQRKAGHDVEYCFAGSITVSQFSMAATD
jgi:5'-nucleotidase